MATKTINDLAKFTTMFYEYSINGLQTHEIFKLMNEQWWEFQITIHDNDWEGGGGTGEDGHSIVINDSSPLDTKTSLPAQGIEIGDAYFVLDDSNLYVWNGTSWEGSGSLKGTDGESFNILLPINSEANLPDPATSNNGDGVFTLDKGEFFLFDGTDWVSQGIMKGASFNPKGLIDNKAAIDALTGMNTGDAYVTVDTSVLYVYNGTAWVDMGKIKGEDGLSFTAKGTIINKAAIDALTGMVKGDSYVTEDTSIMYTYDGTSWVDMGRVKGDKGDKGEDGSSVSIKGSKPTSTDLLLIPLADLTEGDGYIINDTGNLWIWIGPTNNSLADWSDVGSIKGPTGSDCLLKGLVANRAALDSITVKEIGDGYITEDMGELFVYNGTTWVSGGITRGSAGADFTPRGRIFDKDALDTIFDMVKGDSYVTLDTSFMWTYNGTEWVNMGRVKGETGEDYTAKGLIASKAVIDGLISMVKGDSYVTEDTSTMYTFDGTDWQDMGVVKGADGHDYTAKGTIANKAAIDALTGMVKGDSYVTEDTSIMYTYDGTTWEDMGRVRGDKGFDYTAKGTIANKAAIDALTGMVKGDSYVTEDTYHLYTYDGTSWVDMGLIKGDKGETGTSINIKGRVDSENDLLTIVNPVIGDAYIVDTTGDLYIFIGPTNTTLDNWNNTGKIEGPAGADFTFKGTIIDKAAIDALTNMVKGDTWMTEDTSELFVYDGNAWVSSGVLKGEDGHDYTAKGTIANKATIDALTGMVKGDSYVTEDTSIMYTYDGTTWVDMGAIKGNAGHDVIVLGSVATEADLLNVVNPSIGDSYIVEATGHVHTFIGPDPTSQSSWQDGGLFKGNPGADFTFKGTIANKAAIDALTGMVKGDAWMTEDTSELFVYDGAVWQGSTSLKSEIQGSSFTARGTLDLLTELNALTGMVKGDAWHIIEDSNLYVFDGTSWINMGRFKGNEGASFNAHGFKDTEQEILDLTDMVKGDAWTAMDTKTLLVYNGDIWIDMGYIGGLDGEAGADFTPKGTLPDIDALNAVTGMVKGDTYVVLENNNLYCYDGLAWSGQGPIDTSKDGSSYTAKGTLPDKATIDNVPTKVKGDAYIAEDTGIMWCYDGTTFVSFGVVVAPPKVRARSLADIIEKLYRNEPTRIVCAGDSITAGWHSGSTPPTTTYPMVLEKIIQDEYAYVDTATLAMYNLGQNGLTSAGAITDAYIESIKEKNPDLVILMCGANDKMSMGGVSVAEYQRNLSKFIELTRDYVVILMSPTYNTSVNNANGLGSNSKIFIDGCRDVAEYYGVPYIDMGTKIEKYFEYGVYNRMVESPDYFHFSSNIYSQMAYIVFHEALDYCDRVMRLEDSSISWDSSHPIFDKCTITSAISTNPERYSIILRPNRLTGNQFILSVFCECPKYMYFDLPMGIGEVANRTFYIDTNDVRSTRIDSVGVPVGDKYEHSDLLYATIVPRHYIAKLKYGQNTIVFNPHANSVDTPNGWGILTKITFENSVEEVTTSGLGSSKLTHSSLATPHTEKVLWARINPLTTQFRIALSLSSNSGIGFGGINPKNGNPAYFIMADGQKISMFYNTGFPTGSGKLEWTLRGSVDGFNFPTSTGPLSALYLRFNKNQHGWWETWSGNTRLFSTPSPTIGSGEIYLMTSNYASSSFTPEVSAAYSRLGESFFDHSDIDKPVLDHQIGDTYMNTGASNSLWIFDGSSHVRIF